MSDIVDSITVDLRLDRRGDDDTVEIEHDGERLTPDIVLNEGDLLEVKLEIEVDLDDDDDDYRIDGDLR